MPSSTPAACFRSSASRRTFRPSAATPPAKSDDSGRATGLDALRRQGTGGILAHGGVSFAQSLVQLDVVDEYRLTVIPYLAGSGAPLFPELANPGELELGSSTAFADGVLTLVYGRRG